MANVDFTLEDMKKLIRDSLVEERKYTAQLIRDSALEERKHTRRAIEDTTRKLLQNEREITRAVIRQELGESGSIMSKLTSLTLAVGQNSKDIAELKAKAT